MSALTAPDGHVDAHLTKMQYADLLKPRGSRRVCDLDQKSECLREELQTVGSFSIVDTLLVRF